MTSKPAPAIPQLEGLTFAHGLKPAFGPMAKFADFLTGRSSQEQPDSEGLALSRDIVLGRAGYGEPFCLCMHLCGRWHVVTQIPAFDRSLEALRSKMTTTEPREKKRQEERLARERERQEDIKKERLEAAKAKAARQKYEREQEAKQWAAIQATRGNL